MMIALQFGFSQEMIKNLKNWLEEAIASVRIMWGGMSFPKTPSCDKFALL